VGISQASQAAPLLAGGSMLDVFSVSELTPYFAKLYPDINISAAPVPQVEIIDEDTVQDDIEDAEFQIEILQGAIEELTDEDDIEDAEFQIEILEGAIEEFKSKLK